MARFSLPDPREFVRQKLVTGVRGVFNDTQSGEAPVPPSDEAFFAKDTPIRMVHADVVSMMVGGMAALPGSEWRDGRGPEGPQSIRHVFTHFALTLTIERRAAPPDGVEGWWQPLRHLNDAGLPTLYAKAARLMQEEPVHA